MEQKKSSKKITKLLVANRSEIACRIFQGARELGIKTVGVFAPGDEEARHVTYAQEVYPVSHYLNAEEILRVARESGATLIHPGYGFLSERSYFVKAVEGAGVIFIGPRAETMELMGEKIKAKEFAASVGVPTLPWKKVSTGESVKDAAKKVGFPLLIKASAGGGGKGMRRVDSEKGLEEAAESASREALNAFGDGTLFLEKLVESPRHIEVQVFGDGLGGGVHLYERECSLQRRHQKIWEESRAPHLPQKTLQGLFDSAEKLLKSTKYRNAGTLEFLVDAKGDFYFLEMNTRLQVEHPVTELVSGVDLVHAQILQALSPKEALLKSVPAARGHAIEVRLYAEDPSQDFMPQPGVIRDLVFPMGPGIRVDSGVEVGQTVNPAFDSMLAKLIVSAETRALAIARLKYALEETVILGAGTNQAYLLALCNHPKVQEGKVDTGFLGREFSQFKMVPSAIDFSLVSDLKPTHEMRRRSQDELTQPFQESFSKHGDWL